MPNLNDYRCLVCDAPMTGDDSYGSFEFDIYCSEDRKHFRHAANFFGTYINVLDRKFNSLVDAEKYAKSIREG